MQQVSIRGTVFFYFILFCAICALSVAFFTEYFMGFPPCKLCLYKRIPFFILIKLSAIGVISKNLRLLMSWCILLVLLVAVGVSGYHVGVERGVFEAGSTCNPDITILEEMSAQDIKDMLYAKPVATCAKAPFKIFTLSMTEWNMLFNLGLFAIVALLIRKELCRNRSLIKMQ